MKVTIYGSGYVGLVTGSLLADVGNDVLCVDVDIKKVANLKKGIIPIFEPGLDDVIKRNVEAKRLDFTTDMDQAVAHSEVQFIAVGTPPGEDGSADMQYVAAVAKTISERMTENKIVVNKSTVPVGTGDMVENVMDAELKKRSLNHGYIVVSNPEFLKEGAAIDDFMKPDRIVIGTDNEHAIDVMRELYGPFCRNHDKIIFMNRRSSELTKYAANSLLATKISFMNELSNIADRVGADIEDVRIGIGSDPRIGYHFIYPGCGYGGSCFPKDVKALVATARGVDYEAELLASVDAVNDRQKHVLFEKLMRHFDNDINGKCFAVWGLSFKPNTDDLREAASRVLIESIFEAGGTVRAYDPVAMSEMRHFYPDEKRLELVGTAQDTAMGADALLICTEWSEFRSPDLDALKKSLKQAVIIDGRNLYDPATMREAGFIYDCIGRPQQDRRRK
ncbi:MAG: UDP-glucose/GDP-mannose dehydrogenase family protein [Granulosicoccaceae bacterium]